MMEKEWARKYTDEQYLTKGEVAAAMQTSLIDGYWNDISDYRKRFYTPFAFRTITNRVFFYTGTEIIKTKITAMELKCAHLLAIIKKVTDPQLLEQVHRLCFLTSLKAISLIENAQMSDLSIKALLNGTYQENNPFHQTVIGYHAALGYYLTSSSAVRPNEDFLADAYGKNLQSGELTRFYRTTDFDNSAQRARYMYSPDYKFAPHDYIDSLMTEFMTWLRSSDEASFVKMVAALYFLDYVMPFDERNDEVAALLGKAVFASSEAGHDAFLLPFETVLVKTARYKSLALETQRTADLTYLVNYSLQTLDPVLDAIDQGIKDLKIDTYRGEFTTLEGDERNSAGVSNKSVGGVAEQLSLFTPIADEKQQPAADHVAIPPVSPAPIDNIVPDVKPASKSEQQPVTSSVSPVEPPLSAEAKVETDETPVPAISKPVVKPVRSITPDEMTMPSPSTDGERTLSVSGTSGLSEKEIKEYIQYLLETNPSINKNQASFLANHCTVGRYYSIQQFKKFTRCAYETARTSMDKLASEHYYEKLQVKNKFVYTPIRKGENK